MSKVNFEDIVHAENASSLNRLAHCHYRAKRSETVWKKITETAAQDKEGTVKAMAGCMSRETVLV